MLNPDIGCKLILHVACRKLKDKDTFSKSDPQVLVYIKNQHNGNIQQNWEFLGKTELIKDNLNPNFKESFILDYLFEVKQPIKFEIRDVDGNNYESLGSVESTIGILFGSKNQTCIHDIDIGGKLITMVEKYQDTNEYVILKIKGSNFKGSWCSNPNPSFKIFKNENNNEYFAYESEVIHKTNNPNWKLLTLQKFKLGNRFKFMAYDSITKEVGSTQLLFQDLSTGKRMFQLTNNGGVITFDQFETIIKPSFMDYIQGGTQLNLSLAIDFTGSNGDQHDRNSLHFINSNNQYMQALTSVGEILLAYDYDKMIPCYGFGAKLHYPNLTSNQAVHCFPLSGDPQNTSAFQMDGIIQMYQHALNHVYFSGPTYFGPIINETMKLAQQMKQDQSNQYLVLLILTDGAIHDMQQVQEMLERAAFLPMSIIIVGVGNDDFSLMEQLDGDLPQGMYSNKRDLVQFVPYIKFKNSIMLAREVLAELPTQLIQYMEQQGIPPNPAPIHNLDGFHQTLIQQ